MGISTIGRCVNMTSFSEDKIFKNINDKDARILLDIIGVSSVKVRIWTKEMRLFDPKDYVPDIILELDFANLILEIQSTPVDDEFSKRGLTYVAIGNRNKDNDKDMELAVLSTAEESKIVRYRFSKDSVFTYRVINLRDLDANEIINTVEPKIKKGLEINTKEMVLYALIPLIIGEDMEKYIKRVVHNILQVENATESVKNLAYGIEWLIVDKFMKDEEYRQILCDCLGGRMTLLYEYVERKEKNGIKKGIKKGMKEMLLCFIDSGDSLAEISKKTGKSVEELEEILSA